MGEAQQAQQSQQPKHPQALKTGRQDRRGEQDYDDLDRVLSQPAAAVGHDREHYHHLDQEGNVGRPVERDGDRVEAGARLRLVDGNRGHG